MSRNINNNNNINYNNLLNSNSPHSPQPNREQQRQFQDLFAQVQAPVAQEAHRAINNHHVTPAHNPQGFVHHRGWYCPGWYYPGWYYWTPMVCFPVYYYPWNRGMIHQHQAVNQQMAFAPQQMAFAPQQMASHHNKEILDNN